MSRLPAPRPEAAYRKTNRTRPQTNQHVLWERDPSLIYKIKSSTLVRFLIVGLYPPPFGVKIDQDLKSVAPFTLRPDLYKFRCCFNEDLTVFTQIRTAALSKIFFIFLFKDASFLLDDQSLVLCDPLNLYTVEAHRHLWIL